MAEVKGAQLNGTMGFLRERFGDDVVDKAIESLNPLDRALLPNKFFDSNWYSYDVLRAIRSLSRKLPITESLGVDIGKSIAQYTFTGVYKSLLAKTPVKQVQSFGFIHDFFYKDTNKVETTLFSPTTCMVRYRYEEGTKPMRSTCEAVLGFWLRTLELSGGKNVKGTHDKCVNDGHTACDFHFEWD